MEIKSKDLVEQNPFLKWFHRRIKNNYNCIVAIVGDTGSGKSYTALRLAEQLDPNFNVDRVAFTGERFLELLKEDLPKGSCIIFDEAGVDFQARAFMSFLNRALSFALQTIRLKNHNIFFTLPDINFMDAQGRKLIHMIMVVKKRLRSRKVAIVKPYIISTNHRTGKVYDILPRIIVDGQLSKIDKLEIKLPSIKLRRAYERKKEPYVVKDVLGGATAQLKKMNNKERKERLNDRQKLLQSLDKAKLSGDDIFKVMGVSRQQIYKLRSEYKRITTPT